MSGTLTTSAAISDVSSGRGARGELSYGRFYARSNGGGTFDAIVVNHNGALCWRDIIDRHDLKRLFENATDIETGSVDDIWRKRWLRWSE